MTSGRGKENVRAPTNRAFQRGFKISFFKVSFMLFKHLTGNRPVIEYWICVVISLDVVDLVHRKRLYRVAS